MKKELFLFITTIIVFFASCNNKRLEVFEVSDQQNELSTELKNSNDSEIFKYGRPIPGRIIIEISEDMLEEMEISDMGEIRMNSTSSEMQAALSTLKASKAERLFPIDPRYEGRKKKMGMHLWYKITIDENTNLSTAINMMKKIPGIVHVEYEPMMQMCSESPSNSLLNYQNRSKTLPFNDPLLNNQWHYNNIKQLSGSAMGADINLFRAWEITTGTPNVIVCVVDGGISVEHEDLVDNIWINEKEYHGTPDVDDDNNGYIDDIYGYNFAYGNGTIIPDDDFHGTHVAGTVAAVNNNGIGVCGVAGGNGSKGSGVRLMSATVFSDKKGQGGFATAIVYGADNGAVISQNSWGNQIPGPTSTSTKKAIDYFRKYAGCDDNGNQLPNSPMKEGVVIVASGNANSEARYAPAEYEPSIAVNAMGPDFKKATYSNYGNWTDITAPVGDQRVFGTKGGVLSTVLKNEYVYYHGTSMACPHVSGVAALVVSQRGGQGFTAKELEEILMAAVLPVDINKENPQYAGKLGVGYIDAYAALTIKNLHKKPNKPIFLPKKSTDEKFDELTVYWQVPKDEDDGTPSNFRLYYSTEKLTKENFKSAKTTGNAIGMISCQGLQEGAEMQHTINRLSHSTSYYFAIVAIDRWNQESEPSFMQLNTKKNLPPEITNLPTEPISLIDMLGSTKYELKVKDPDGHQWKYKLSGDTKGITCTQGKDNLTILIRNVLDHGEYQLTITLTDELGTSKDFIIPFLIIEAQEPKVSNPIPDLIVGVENEPIVINLSDYFEPQKYFTLQYKATVGDGTIIGTQLDKDGKLTIKAYKQGSSPINITASNGYKETTTFFTVSATKDSSLDVYSVWPLPIVNDLNIWLNPKISKAKVELLNVHGEVIYKKDVTADYSGIAKVDMKKVAPGSYTLRISGGNKPFIKSVLKR